MTTYRDINAAGDVTTWLRDEATGLVTNKVYADGKGPRYDYTPDGKLATRTWARGIVTTYSYDDNGSLTNTVYSDGTPTISLAYNRAGRQIQAIDAAGVTTFAYDDFGALTNETVIGVAGTNTIIRHWDNYGRTTGYSLVELAGPCQPQRQSTLAYDPANGRLATMLVAGSETPFIWNYLAGSNLKSSLDYPNGFTAYWQYDANNQLLQVRNAFPTNTISQYDYVYDAAGRRVQISRSGSAMSENRTDVYGYNERGELVSAAKNAEGAEIEYAYEYDDIGNRISSLELDTNRTYIANNLNQYTTISNFASTASTAAEFHPQFDDDGNQILIQTATGIWLVQYNGENRPIHWSNGVTNIVMSYDRMGRRVTKNDLRFVYDGYLQIADNDGNAYFWDPTYIVATRPIAWKFLSNLSYYIHDDNKNVSEVVAENGNVTAHYEYTPFGAVAVLRGAFALNNPWRFSSEYAEDALGLVYYNFRHYNSLVGRWLTRDIMHPASDVNPYRSGYLDWLGLSEIIASTKIYSDDVNVALIALTNITETTIQDVFKWNKVEPYSKEEGRRPNKDCCEYTGKAIEYYRKLKISYKASTDPAKIITVEWFHSSGIPEEDIALYNQLYAIVMAHEEGHISIMEKYRSKLNKDFEDEDSSCYDGELLSYGTLESFLQDEAEVYFDKVLKEWHDANNAYQKEEETKGRHKEFEKIKSEYDKKRKGK